MGRAIWGTLGLIGLFFSALFLQGAGFRTAPAPTDIDVIVDSVRAQVPKEVSWALDTPTGGTGSFYVGGFYKHVGTANDFNPAVNFGDANNPYAAHLYFVAGPVATGPDTIVCIGATINDSATLVDPDTVIVVFTDSDAEDTFKETSEKWLGTVAIENADGSPRLFNYGYAKYWDNNNTDYTLKGFEALWAAGADDTGFALKLFHHKEAGWNYRAGNTASNTNKWFLNGDVGSTYDNIENGNQGAWKRADLDSLISGSGSEGLILEVTTTANNAIEFMTFMARVTQ